MLKTLLAVSVTCLLLQGCAAIVATGAATGASVAHDRRTTGTQIEDEAIEFKIANAYRRVPELDKQSHINITSYNGIVLLTGETPDDALREQASQLARTVEKVRQVHNELTIAAPSSFLSRSSDVVIFTKIKTAMFVDHDLDPTRIDVTVENGAVYLMGLVTRSEGDVATSAARQVSGVQRVVKLFEYFD